MTLIYGWRCIRCNLDGRSLTWAASQQDLDTHRRTVHDRPMPEAVEANQ